jgi:repressor LexA
MGILTHRQQLVYQAILDFYRDQGYAPTVRNIMRELNLSSPATVHQHIKALKQKHMLQDSPQIIPIDAAFSEKTIQLPLVGLITAGEPIEAIEEHETVGVPESLVPSSNCFVLKVRGTSMIEEGILDGDYVIVERNFYPLNGQIVVALLDNAYATLKKYYREKTRIRLQPANASMGPIYVTNPAIQGVVKAVLRRFE